MAIKIAMTGSGTVGDIMPGWNINEFATPVTIGETTSGSGNVSFNAEAKSDSLFLANNNITTTHTDAAVSLGSVSGTVKTVSQNGPLVTVNHTNNLAKFDADFNIPYLNAGTLWSAVDLLTQITETVRIGIAPFTKDV